MNINVIAGWRAVEQKMSDRKSSGRCVALRIGAARIGLAAALLLLGAPDFAQVAKPVFRPMDVFDLQWAADPQISPDGRSIAYVRMSFDIKTDRPHGAVWLVGADGKHARPLPSIA